MIGCTRLLKNAGAMYATHLRNESEAILPAMEEAFEVGRRAGSVPVVLSHHKVIIHPVVLFTERQ